ncbi:hypothetical protein LSS_11860 [Leptospira santarosai serovar Shermani str. LT 821]|uniref:Uncharacterized protein n=1 Tax=Leptospira santarosai serovar Shermani str. LT 821 TaxID=758847 RepID=K8Y0I6_9LEPT|nr:hypothetical protein LSS_11860 [Leptospira santarosai serovar Shermani str. LT 821]
MFEIEFLIIIKYIEKKSTYLDLFLLKFKSKYRENVNLLIFTFFTNFRIFFCSNL